jgi:hypothetical protein
MSHKAQKDFLLRIKSKFPYFFKGVKVLDIGSLDINGNNRFLFEESLYIGVDVGPGKNVDVVCPGHLFTSKFLFDVVISTECFEHDIHYKETILNAVSLTKPGGIFLFTCASTGRKVHGTSTKGLKDNPFLPWSDYYKNLTEEDVREVLDCSKFSEFYFEYYQPHRDLYFYGIKNV